jgi:hypothetical protein
VDWVFDWAFTLFGLFTGTDGDLVWWGVYMTATKLTFWDHVTLLGALGIVVGYVVFRIRVAMNPSKGGCSGCGHNAECLPPSGSNASSQCAPPSTSNSQ